jgi:hypothetical protein
MDHLARPEHLRTLYALLLELGTNLEEASQQIQAMDPDAKAPLTGLSTKLDELAREIERLEADRSE